MADFTGKTGLIVGVANKRSIAWAIAQATASRGARLALTYQGRFEEHVNELASGLAQDPDPQGPRDSDPQGPRDSDPQRPRRGGPLVLPCDVSSDQDITSVF